MFNTHHYQRLILQQSHPISTHSPYIALQASGVASIRSSTLTDKQLPETTIEMETTRQRLQETQTERDSRSAGNFAHVESCLPKKWSGTEWNFGDALSSLLGSQKPFAKEARTDKHTVWLLDNTAYRPIHPYPHRPQPWQAEFVACFFIKGRKNSGKYVASIADQIGLDGEKGSNQDAEVRRRIAERLQPFLNAIAPARTITISIPCPSGEAHNRILGPSNRNGISSQVVLTGGGDHANGTTITPTSVEMWNPQITMETHFAAPEGWGVISDIDDSIKITQTSDAVGILRTTFAEEPQPIAGMPEFYKHVQTKLNKPVWFYLSASPYNLYPFLHKFLHAFYHPGTLILRENSWHDLGGLLKSFTQGTQAYKVSRIEKIHDWLPQRKFLCVGDSTQSDPEAYGEIARKYPGWIRAIFIRRVTDIMNMEQKNKDERFLKAFEGVDPKIWKVFENPADLYHVVDHMPGTAHEGIVGGVQGLFCPTKG